MWSTPSSRVEVAVCRSTPTTQPAEREVTCIRVLLHRIPLSGLLRLTSLRVSVKVEGVWRDDL